MGIVVALLVLAVLFLVVSLIVTAVKWLAIIALFLLILGIVSGLRSKRQR